MNIEEVLIQALQECEIFYEKEKIEVLEYENLIISTMVRTLLSDNKKNLFIGIEEKLQLIFLIIITAIKNYFEEMKDPENNIIDILSSGDKVCYKGRIYRYGCITNLKKEKYIQLIDSDLSTYVPIKDQHLISVYNGQATRINKVKGEKLTENKTKRFISSITNTEINKLNGVVNSSSIIVYRGKEDLINTINSIKIKLGDEKYLLSELFSLAYFSSEDNFEFFKGNRIKENPVIKFVSNVGIALEIVKNREIVKDIICVGESSYKDSIETELRMMNLLPSVKNILLLDTWESTMDYSLVVSCDQPYQIYAFTREVIRENINLCKSQMWKIDSKLQILNYQMAFNMLKKDISICVIESAEVLNACIRDVISNVKKLCEFSNNNDIILEFIKGAYFLCNKIEESIMPLINCEINKNIIMERINGLVSIVKRFEIERVEHKLMNNILDEIYIGIKEIEVKSLKLHNVRRNILKYGKAFLLLKNKVEIPEVEQYIKRTKQNNIIVKHSFKKITEIKCGCVIASYNYNNKDINLLNTNLVQNIQYVLYQRESYRLKILMRKNNLMLSSIYNNNQLKPCGDGKYEKLGFDTEIVSVENDNDSIFKNENEIKKFIDDNKLNILLNIGKSESQRSNTYGKIKVKSLISFDDDNYAFISENYVANVLDRKSNDIKNKTWDEIQIDDEIIFVKNRLTDKDDIIKAILKELLKTPKFKEMYGEYFRLNLVWKEALIVYMKKNSLNERDISKQFKLYGREVMPGTINHWLNGTIIGPQDSENIEIIASIVKDKYIKDNINAIISACKNERKIQISVRKAVARIIIESVTKEEDSKDEIYNLIKNSVDDLNRYAYIGTVNDIRMVEDEIGASYVNCIIESED